MRDEKEQKQQQGQNTEGAKSEKQEQERLRDERIEQTGQLTLERHGEDEKALHMISIIGEIAGLLFLLTTRGGEVEAGRAIAEMIASLC